MRRAIRLPGRVCCAAIAAWRHRTSRRISLPLPDISSLADPLPPSYSGRHRSEAPQMLPAAYLVAGGVSKSTIRHVGKACNTLRV